MFVVASLLVGLAALWVVFRLGYRQGYTDGLHNAACLFGMEVSKSAGTSNSAATRNAKVPPSCSSGQPRLMA